MAYIYSIITRANDSPEQLYQLFKAACLCTRQGNPSHVQGIPLELFFYLVDLAN